MQNDRWNEFLNALPPEFLEPSYCVCGCGVDRMKDTCKTGHRY